MQRLLFSENRRGQTIFVFELFHPLLCFFVIVNWRDLTGSSIILLLYTIHKVF